MKFVHAADLHIGATPEAGRPWGRERAGAVSLALPKVIELCNETDADLLLIPGDLFDRQPLRKDLREAAYNFSRLKKAQVVIIAGNHDFLSEDSPYASFDLGKHVHLIKTANLSSVWFPELNTEVHGLSYYSHVIRQPLYDRLRAPRDGRLHILLAHGGDAEHIPVSYSRLAESGFDYVALGHIHQPRVFKGLPMAYSGSPEPLDRTDLGQRGCLSGEVTGESFSLQWHPIASSQYREAAITVRPVTTESEIRERIISELRTRPLDLLCVRLTGRRDPSLQIDADALLSLGRICSLSDETKADYDLDALLRNHRDDMIGKYILAFKDRDDPLSEKALYYGLDELVKGD